MTKRELIEKIRNQYWGPTKAGLVSLPPDDAKTLIVEALKTRQDWTVEELYSIATIASMLLQDLELTLSEELGVDIPQ